ncbi:MAG: hypothetical protein SCM96_04010 [Acidobacteriota bacterium]|nr:hypothetical protein [Acidobacteriota bacterium]
MKKFLTSTTCLIFLSLLVHGAAFAQKVNTGDRKLDSYLEKINEKASADPDVFFHQLSRKHGTPEEEIRQAMERHRLSYGDTYMATGLSRISKRPIGVVAEEYKQNQGRGWGVTAMSMGIKPGSPEFKQLKANARGSLGHMKSMAKARKAQQKQELVRAREHDRKTKDEARGKAQRKGKKK